MQEHIGTHTQQAQHIGQGIHGCFVVANKTRKVVGFQIQEFTTHQPLDMFPLEPGQTKVGEVNITENGFRFRCPINPTPWYDVENVQAK